jgi:hypothetical protein
MLDPSDPDHTLIWTYSSAQHLHQRALACAVLAQERMHATGVRGEVHAFQRNNSAVGFSDALQFNK